MTLNFMKIWPSKMAELAATPTYFVEKILSGLLANGLIAEGEDLDYYSNYKDQFGEAIDRQHLATTYQEPKIHTIRYRQRFTKDDLIHFKIWSGAPYKSKTYDFAPNLKCTGTQSIMITNHIRNEDGECIRAQVFIDGVSQPMSVVKTLCRLDGFAGPKEFFRYFSGPFSGQIIHWTQHRY